MTKILNLGYSLAESIIKDYFAQNDDLKKEEAEMMAFCRENYPPIYSQQVAYRIQRRHINHIVVKSVLADLPKLQREVIIRKYKKREMNNKISMELNISIRKISDIVDSVRDNINNMLKYTLTVKDVYSRVKVVNMIHILDLRLSFLDKHPEIMPDVDRDWMKSLYICREKYRKLYSAMEDAFRKAETSLHYSIIAEQLRDSSLSSKELSSLCHVTQNAVNRHLRTYENDMAKYLVA